MALPCFRLPDLTQSSRGSVGPELVAWVGCSGSPIHIFVVDLLLISGEPMPRDITTSVERRGVFGDFIWVVSLTWRWVLL